MLNPDASTNTNFLKPKADLLILFTKTFAMKRKVGEGGNDEEKNRWEEVEFDSYVLLRDKNR